MRCIVQRVKQASVSVGEELVSSIGRGMCVLVGIHRDDTEADADWMVRKLLNLRIFHPDGEDRWQSSVKDNNLEILCVSQFTLYAVLKGNKPDFHQSMRADTSKQFFDHFIANLKRSYNEDLVKIGSFGSYMAVNIVNDGPVTITLDSPKKPDVLVNKKITNLKLDNQDEGVKQD
jgi:D-tyrosyl-tRNA(Tyr) deacylase